MFPGSYWLWFPVEYKLQVLSRLSTKHLSLTLFVRNRINQKFAVLIGKNFFSWAIVIKYYEVFEKVDKKVYSKNYQAQLI